ncbi:PREDICTED: uncharacterized protein LOC105567239 [Vollenhovia emeryi]|uniref:uncharacterized protein LOC105567239 n=1 Tax=Vollenhovia emeryi TaxID=411798 RepID=UPI0005F389AD|nr:PREDICTED: uncharacterized protein LOC105567239 [Vollenhovia emeryi]XP_011877332.1 PREDICTED: uncharacterized protein LOC105567239 [Vollenhovia emeryi]
MRYIALKGLLFLAYNVAKGNESVSSDCKQCHKNCCCTIVSKKRSSTSVTAYSRYGEKFSKRRWTIILKRKFKRQHITVGLRNSCDAGYEALSLRRPTTSRIQAHTHFNIYLTKTSFKSKAN